MKAKKEPYNGKLSIKNGEFISLKYNTESKEIESFKYYIQ